VYPSLKVQLVPRKTNTVPTNTSPSAWQSSDNAQTPIRPQDRLDNAGVHLVIRHASAQILILAHRVAEQVLGLIQGTDPANVLDKLYRHVSRYLFHKDTPRQKA